MDKICVFNVFSEAGYFGDVDEPILATVTPTKGLVQSINSLHEDVLILKEKHKEHGLSISVFDYSLDYFEWTDGLDELKSDLEADDFFNKNGFKLISKEKFEKIIEEDSQSIEGEDAIKTRVDVCELVVDSNGFNWQAYIKHTPIKVYTPGIDIKRFNSIMKRNKIC